MLRSQSASVVGGSAVGRRAIPVRRIAEQVVTALRRMNAERTIEWSILVDDTAVFMGDENDLLELLGNLAENASKWARSEVSIRSGTVEGNLTIRVEYDGPGLPEGEEANSLVRGRRLDETGGVALAATSAVPSCHGRGKDGCGCRRGPRSRLPMPPAGRRSCWRRPAAAASQRSFTARAPA